MISKRKLRKLYRGYLFSYTFEVFTPRAIVEVEPPFEVISSDDNEQVLFGLAALLLD